MPLRLTLLTLTTLLLSLGLFTLTPAQASACGILTSSVPRGYGVPQNFFSGSRELTVNAQCEDDTFQPIVGSSRTDSNNFAVYTRGYLWTGEEWESYSLTPGNDDASEAGA